MDSCHEKSDLFRCHSVICTDRLCRIRVSSFLRAAATNANNSFIAESSGSPSSELIPVELVSFIGEKSSNGVVLIWVTASEINNNRHYNAFDNIQRVHRGEKPAWVVPELAHLVK